MASKIIITTSKEKKELLKNNQLEDRKIYTYEEFKRLFYFDYNEKTILYIMEKYKVKRAIAQIYLNNLYYIEDKTYKNKKLIFLKQVKEDLLLKKLLFINKLFIKSLENKTILFYRIPISKEIDYLIKQLKEKNEVKIENPREKYPHTIYAFPTLEEEVVFLANDIIEKANKGISFQHFFLLNLDEEYRKAIKRIFPMFHIPFSLKEDVSLFSTPIGKKLLHFYDNDFSNTLSHIEAKTEEETAIYNQIITILNKYAFEPNKEKVKELIIYDLKNTYVPSQKKENVVKEASLEAVHTEEDYVYLVAFNQNVIPQTFKDEDYLTDKDKIELSASTTREKNNLEKNRTIEYIENIKNLTITYKLNHNGEEFSLSNINEILKYPIIEDKKASLQYSNLYNQTKLTSMLDEYYKYGTSNEELEILYNHYLDLPYKTYNNQFTGIKKEDLQEYLDNKLSLSYTKLNTYYSCPFSYYINYILKINEEEDTFAITIGNLFHSVLEHHKEDFDSLWEKEVKKIEYPLTEKEYLFLEKLKEELRFVINRIHEQENFTELHEELYEENVITNVNENPNIIFSGKIDKIKYKKVGDKTIATIIDYKTGSTDYDLGLIDYGLHLQLPIYIYLAKQIKKLDNIEIAGIYLQKILNNEITLDNKHSYEELKKKKLLLQGYSCSDINTLSLFDTSYVDSNLIQSMKVVKSGYFSSYAKVLSKEELDKLEGIAIKKIEEAAQDIKNANFKIEPKKIGNKFDGCMFCKLKDICYRRRENTLELEERKLKDVLGGEEDGLDEGTRKCHS